MIKNKPSWRAFKEDFILAKNQNHINQQIKKGATLIIEDPVEYYGFTQAANVILLCGNKLSDEEHRVYLAIRSFAYGGKKNCFPGQETIGKLVGKSRENVNRIIQQLKIKGLLKIIRRGLGLTNIYILCRIPDSFIEEHQKIKDVIEKQNHKPANPWESNDVTLASHQVVTPASQEENKYNDLVVEHPTHILPNTKEDKPQISNSSTNDIGTNTTGDVIKPNPKVEEIRKKVNKISRVNISIAFAKQIIKKYSLEQISTVLQEMEKQLKTGVQIKGVGAWLNAALAQGYETDTVPPPQKQLRTKRTPQVKHSQRYVHEQGNTFAHIRPEDDKRLLLLKKMYSA